ncbi:MAG: helix-turn-helix domain-containing protein [Clostridia bacterium]|nr:helix-turn-helix domain-containing protein [Clostridia bacterium]
MEEKVNVQPDTANLSRYNPFEYIFNLEDLKFSFVAPHVLGTPVYNSLDLDGDEHFMSQVHSHHFFEMFYCESGDLEVYIEDKFVTVPPNHILCVYPKVHHTARCLKESKCCTVRFTLESNGIKSDFPIFSSLKKRLLNPYTFFKATSEIEYIISQLDVIADNSTVTNKQLMMNCVYSFITLLVHNLKNSVPSEVAEANVANPGTPSREYQMTLLINTNYTQNITLKYIADALFLSERQTSRLIYEHYGMTFNSVIKKYRMEKAAQLLKITDMSITEIAHTVGYSSLNGFYNTFKEHFGCLPLYFKKNANKHHSEPAPTSRA